MVYLRQYRNTDKGGITMSQTLTITAEQVLASLGLGMLVQGTGKVIAQVPAAGTKVYSHCQILVTGQDAFDSYTDILK